MIDLAEVLARHWPSYERTHGSQLLPSHRAAVAAIQSCRTSQRGGHLFRCESCARSHYAYHSCGHRACPKCGHAEATEWIAHQKTRLLPVPYFLVTFTVPSALRALIRSQQKELYGRLLRESAAAMQEVASREKHLGAQLGLLGVLHTWSRQLIYHPHVHFVVAGGGLTEDGLRWKRVKSPDFFLPTRVLARRFRTRLKQALQQNHPREFASLPSGLWRQDWVVDCQAVGRGESALKYLSAYVYRTALGSQRIVRDQNGQITFTYRDRDSGQTRITTVSADEFLRRFLQHVLPSGFQRVRYYGWLAPAAKARRARIEALLDWKRPAPPESPPSPPPTCPHCHQPMVWVRELPRKATGSPRGGSSRGPPETSDS